MAEFTTLYSGSSGNCSIVREGNKFILIDIGKSTRKTLECLAEIGALISDLSAILITHEHSDHVYGLTVFLKKHNVPVYATEQTAGYLKKKKIVPHYADMRIITDNEEQIDDFTVSCFSTSHDSVQCCGYKIRTKTGKTIALATDLGCITPEVYENLCGADLVSLEANYDYEMLLNGPYPPYLKQRIVSKKGHLCNEDSAKTVLRLMQNGCKNFMLCHMSKENNTQTHVLSALKGELALNNYIPQKDCVVQVAQRSEVSPILTF